MIQNIYNKHCQAPMNNAKSMMKAWTRTLEHMAKNFSDGKMFTHVTFAPWLDGVHYDGDCFDCNVQELEEFEFAMNKAAANGKSII